MEFRRRAISATRTMYRGVSALEGARCQTLGLENGRTAVLPNPVSHASRIDSAYGAAHVPPILPTNGSIGLLATLVVRQVADHVNRGSHGSPFMSFTGKLAIARSWATEHGARPDGAIVETTISFRFVWWWQATGGRYVFVYEDDCGRAWLRTNSYWGLLEEFTEPAAMAGMRTRGVFDAEWLLLRGAIPSAALVVRAV